MDLIKVIIYILPSKQEREILFEATRTCIWLKLYVCSMCVRFVTQLRLKWSNQVKYFAKVNSAFTIFLQRRLGRFIKFTNLRLFPCFRIETPRSQSVHHLRRPYLPLSHLLLPQPDTIALNGEIKRAFPFYH